MKKREVSMPELLLGEQAHNFAPALITGVSGSGKNFLFDQANWLKKGTLLLDTIGAKHDGKWLTDIAKISKEYDFVLGWSDNLGEVVVKMLSFWEKDTDFTLIWIQPSYDVWKAAQAAKAKDADDTVGSWKADWAAKANWSRSEFERYERGKMDLIVSKTGPDELIVVRNVDVKSPIVKGWHESAEKTSDSQEKKED